MTPSNIFGLGSATSEASEKQAPKKQNQKKHEPDRQKQAEEKSTRKASPPKPAEQKTRQKTTKKEETSPATPAQKKQPRKTSSTQKKSTGKTGDKKSAQQTTSATKKPGRPAKKAPARENKQSTDTKAPASKQAVKKAAGTTTGTGKKSSVAKKQTSPSPRPAKHQYKEVDKIDPAHALAEMTLPELPEKLQQACSQAGWQSLMPVQSQSIPYLLGGQDLMIQSRTGSGKTGAFLLPVLDRLDSTRNQCQALVLVPTRELARQVAQEARVLFGQTGARVVAVYGGTGYSAQKEAFAQGAHLVVGTPGRILDHLMQRTLVLDTLDVLVFDEADRMLSIGFYPDMKAVRQYLPGRRVCMFMTSATYPPHVMRLAGEFMDQPQLLSLSQESIHVAGVTHAYHEVSAMEKDRALVRLLEMENPHSAFIFCNTRQKVHYVTTVLKRFGYNADGLSGDMTQNKREEVVQRIRTHKLRYLVSTDVAARGIDIPDLSHVFMYEPPEDHESYIHRAGRTGRAGAAGEVISLVDVMEKLALERIAKTYNVVLELRQLPTDADIQAITGQRVTALLEKRLRDADSIVHERLQRFVPLASSLGEQAALPELLALLLDDYYQQALHTDLQQTPAPAPEKKQHRAKRHPRNTKPAGT